MNQHLYIWFRDTAFISLPIVISHNIISTSYRMQIKVMCWEKKNYAKDLEMNQRRVWPTKIEQIYMGLKQV